MTNYGASVSLERNATVGVELVVLTVLDDELVVLVAPRPVMPFRNRLALPGGPILPDEDLAEAAERELWEKTRVDSDRVHLEQLGTYGSPDRDPRGRVVTVAYLALVPSLSADLTAGSAITDAGALPDGDGGDDDGGDEDRAAEAEWMPVDDVLDHPRGLAFDHHRILSDGVDRVRARLEYSPLGTAFCPDEFTIGDLRRVYEAVWNTTIDPRNFHRKVSGTADFVVETGRVTRGEGGRPARLFRLGDVDVLHPPLVRPA